MNKVLTIAGSDCSGGAGIQADIKTIVGHGLYAMSAITALTSQNTLGVREVCETPPNYTKSQIEAVFDDIFPDAVKIGMVSGQENIKVIAGRLKYYNARNIVLDPVMVSTSGSSLLAENSVTALTSLLFPIADVITPNIPEAEVLCGMKIKNKNDMVIASKKIAEKYETKAILIKGGHFPDSADDLLYVGGKENWFNSEKIKNENTHGTGCTLSSSIACNLAKGYDLINSVKNAKEYITLLLSDNLNLGKGSGPLNHCCAIKPYIR